MKNSVKISVKNLVEFVLRSGSIDNRFTGIDRAAEGSRIHRKLQKSGGENYRAEVFLSLDSEYENIIFTVEGRADGVITIEDDTVTIDEIKTTVVPLHLIDEDYNRVHWAQAMCYGYIYCIKNELNNIMVQLRYFYVDTEEIKVFRREFSIDELKNFYIDLLAKYKVWADFESEWKSKRDVSIKALNFPFESYRAGQRQLAVGVYKTITEGNKLFCQAPTGIGKTVSTLFPSIKAIGEEQIEKIFYLTAKTITRQVAEEALLKMRSNLLKIKSITLTAKDKICFLEERVCNEEYCKYANGHFDRVNDAMLDVLKNRDCITKEVVEKYAKKHTVCPFELSLDLTLWCDVIICDYNYVFDPQVYLRRFFGDDGGDYAFLIDEAHNLVDRSREMFSASLYKSDFLSAKKNIGKKDKKLNKILTKINSYMIDLQKLCEDEGFHIANEQFSEHNNLLNMFVSDCNEWLKLNRDVEPEFLELYFNVLSYLKISEFYDERYITFLEKNGNDVSVKLFCLDPSYLLGECMKRGKSTILFSATLAPIKYYMSVLGGDENSKYMTLLSSFPQGNMCLLIANRVSTKYKDRETSIEIIADMIYQAIIQKRGNYIVYFPSYKYMNDVYGMFCEKYAEVRTIIQGNKMDESERVGFLTEFDETNEDTLVGFCVLGGIFSEGIDLAGERLIGSIIVGVGLPQINIQQDIIRDYYNKHNNMGFEYAYQYPGMNKIMQAAGRVIRNENDKGIVLLIDDRFTESRYTQLFPSHWRNYKTIANHKELKVNLTDFWGNM